MVVYQESRHSVGNVPAANLGPFPPILVADWLADRLAGKPFAERALVRAIERADRQDADVMCRSPRRFPAERGRIRNDG